MCIRDVRINGRWRVQKADPQDAGKMPAVGVLISKSTPTAGVIQTYGPCSLFLGLDPLRQVYFLGNDGRLSETKPVVGVDGYAFVQFLGKPVSDDIFLINNGGSLNLVKIIG